MISHLLQFFKGRLDEERPVLLGFSGGPDSLALLHLLIRVQKIRPVKFSIAHVDHGWREESAGEAEEIRRMAERLGIPCHLIKLDPGCLQGNLEAACRLERFRFFARLCLEYGYQAVMLGHHADDLAETVLKRALEGAALTCLNGIKSEAAIEGIKVWRPLLRVTKKEILGWLEEKGLRGFLDATNQDVKFLRARLRHRIIPYLSEIFGKEISSSLCQLAEEAAELNDHLDQRTASWLLKVVEGEWGNFLDLGQGEGPQTILEWKHLLRRFCEQCSFGLSRESLGQAAECLNAQAANHSFTSGKRGAEKVLYADRGRLWIPLREVSAGSSWELRVASCHSLPGPSSDWKSLWQQGTGEVILPEGDYVLGCPDGRLAKWWTNHKMPSFFRMEVPVIMEKGQVKHEFLTGKRLFRAEHLFAGTAAVRVTLHLREQQGKNNRKTGSA